MQKTHVIEERGARRCPDKQRRGKRWCGETLCEMRRQWVMDDGLNQVIQIAGAVHNRMYLNRLATNKVKDKVGFNDENPVTVLAKPLMMRHSAQKRLMLELSDSFIKSVNEGNSSSRAVLCNVKR